MAIQTVVSGGATKRAIGMSSKPRRATHAGTSAGDFEELRLNVPSWLQ